jgi:hypothetical protein
LKTGEVKDPGDGTDQYLDCDGWTPWLYYDPSDEELERYYTDTNALMMRLERMPPAVHRRQKRIDIRCPAKGCRLAAVYWLPRRPTAWEIEDNRRRLAMRDANGRPVYSKPYQPGHYLYVGRTPGGAEVYDILNYVFGPSPKDERYGCKCHRRLYWRAGCRHSTATVERASIYDMFFVADRLLAPLQTEEQAVAHLPDHLRPFWGKRVFHPEPAAWHPRKRAA